jgi:D-amino-acid dehydrogenase
MSKSESMVLGAGIVGISTALSLQQQGHDVVLVDRQAPGREASYGNAGMIQREAVEPYAFPRDVATLLKAARGSLNAINYHAGALLQIAAPLLLYWRNSAPIPYRRIARDHSRLIAHCIDEHSPWIDAAGVGHLVAHDGWHQAYRSQRSWAKAAANAERVGREYELDCQWLDPARFADAVPAWKAPVAGSILWKDTWSVRDPGALVLEYARLFEQRGGRVVVGDARTLRPQGAGWAIGAPGTPSLTSAHAVIALGAWAGPLARRLGYDFPTFIKRGYHRHYAMRQPLNVPVLDADNGIVLSPMAQGLRVATGAEFARLDAAPTPVQSGRSEGIVRGTLDIGEAVEVEPWVGARPCTADMLPIVGPGYLHKGLWFNFGHGHQGFTLGPATARLLAEQVAGGRTYVDRTPYLPERFRP